jgi:hypothetical protein
MSIEEHIQAILNIIIEKRDTEYNKFKSAEDDDEKLEIRANTVIELKRLAKQVEECNKKVQLLRFIEDRFASRELHKYEYNRICLTNGHEEEPRFCKIINKHDYGKFLFSIIPSKRLARHALEKLKSDANQFMVNIGYNHAFYNGDGKNVCVNHQPQPFCIGLSLFDNKYTLYGWEPLSHRESPNEHRISKECAEQLLLDIIEKSEAVNTV